MMNMSRTEMNFTFAATADSASSQQAPTINRVLTANELQDIVDEQHHQNNTDEATRPKILHLLLGFVAITVMAIGIFHVASDHNEEGILTGKILAFFGVSLSLGFVLVLLCPNQRYRLRLPM